jgi:hypothetical protein
MRENPLVHDFFSEIDRLLEQGNYDEAKARLGRRLDQNPHDRETELYLLFLNITVRGPLTYESEINRLRFVSDLSPAATEVVRKIFLLAFDAAQKAGREKQAWVYQRLLRRLVLNQPLGSATLQDEDTAESSTLSSDHGSTDEAYGPAAKRQPNWLSRLGHTVLATRQRKLPAQMLVFVALGILIGVIPCFFLARGNVGHEGVNYTGVKESAERALPFLLGPRDLPRAIIGSLEPSAQASSKRSKGTVAANKNAVTPEKEAEPAESPVAPRGFVILLIAILFWAVSLFLVAEAAKSQQWALGNKDGIPEARSGVDMSQLLSCLFVLLWFGRELFLAQPAQGPFHFIWQLLEKPEQLTPGILLAVFPPLLVGLVKLITAMGLRGEEAQNEIERRNRLWVNGVFISLHLIFAIAAAVFLARSVL